MAIANPLPNILEFTANNATEGDFKVALNKLILYLDEVLGADGTKAIPSGLICLWSGSVDNIPNGWALCDGQNGTEDLRDKFVIGAGKSYAVNATGGNTSQAVNLSGSTGATTLTVEQMPWHSHSAPLRKATWESGSGQYFSSNGNNGTVYTGGTGSNWAHSHSLSGSTTVSTLPPNYAKCYIQKL